MSIANRITPIENQTSTIVHPLGLYIHIPFCEKKCPYCDFNTYAGLGDLFQATVDALCAEMETWRARLSQRRLRSIFLGGGTPTVLSEAQLAQLFATIDRCFRLETNCEITCEANPGTVDRAKFSALRRLGVNRLSMGVQSFQAQELQFLGRIHNVDDVLQAFSAARAAGFANINLDFIFGLPEQQLTHWQATLAQALALAPEHLSLYSLIVEPNTPLHHWVKSGKVGAPDEDQAAELYEFALQRLAEAGYRQYEVSNWAKSSAEAESKVMPALASQHNLLYWRNQEYLGIGPGAHSHLRQPDATGGLIGKRWGNRKPVAGYVKRISGGKSVVEFCETGEPAMSMG
ncbi:MAG: radical SAM family heme chaperone HemW, partial [Chloroflexota bacterium]|nr:radical SAM family heme chaperone HemW [Chloroflexota bacterium]